MSSNRNFEKDREITAALRMQVERGIAPPSGIPTWLGHGGIQNVLVDLALLTGSDLSDIEGVTKARALDHIRHLEREHCLEIEHPNGVYRFSLPGKKGAC